MKKKEPLKEPRVKRKENIIFTVWVHTGYAVLILSMISWMVYMEYFMDWKNGFYPALYES